MRPAGRIAARGARAGGAAPRPTLVGALLAIALAGVPVRSVAEETAAREPAAATARAAFEESRGDSAGTGARPAAASSVLRRGTLVAAWSARVGRSCTLPPLLLDDSVVAVSTDGRFSSFRLEDGRRLWSRRIKSTVEAGPAGAAPAGGGVVCVSSRARSPMLLAFAAATGRPLWERELPELAIQIAGSDSAFFVLLRSGALEARSARNGERIWSLDRSDWRPAGIAVAGPQILYLAREDSLLAVGGDGRIAWRAAPGGRFALPPLVDGDHVALAATDGTIVRVSRADGSVVQREPRPGGVTGVASGPEGQVISVTTDGTVRGGAGGGETAGWRVDLDLAVVAAPSVRDGVVLITAAEGTMRALDAGDGASLWSYRSGGGFRVPALIAARTLLLADDRGNLHAYRL